MAAGPDGEKQRQAKSNIISLKEELSKAHRQWQEAELGKAQVEARLASVLTSASSDADSQLADRLERSRRDWGGGPAGSADTLRPHAGAHDLGLLEVDAILGAYDAAWAPDELLLDLPAPSVSVSVHEGHGSVERTQPASPGSPAAPSTSSRPAASDEQAVVEGTRKPLSPRPTPLKVQCLKPRR